MHHVKEVAFIAPCLIDKAFDWNFHCIPTAESSHFGNLMLRILCIHALKTDANNWYFISDIDWTGKLQHEKLYTSVNYALSLWIQLAAQAAIEFRFFSCLVFPIATLLSTDIQKKYSLAKPLIFQQIEQKRNTPGKSDESTSLMFRCLINRRKWPSISWWWFHAFN